MSSVTSFKTIGDKVVQLIVSKHQSKSKIERSMYIARMVDIVCCGVVMLHDGRVFETLPGAYQDCLDGILRINYDSNTIYLKTLQSRVNKLVKRGWKNTINVAKVIKEIEGNRAKAKRKALRQTASLKRKKRPAVTDSNEVKSQMFVYNKEQKHPMGGYMEEISAQEVARHYDSAEHCVSTIHNIAMEKKLNVRVQTTPVGNINYGTLDGATSYIVHKELQKYRKRGSQIIGKGVKTVRSPRPASPYNPPTDSKHIASSKGLWKLRDFPSGPVEHDESVLSTKPGKTGIDITDGSEFGISFTDSSGVACRTTPPDLAESTMDERLNKPIKQKKSGLKFRSSLHHPSKEPQVWVKTGRIEGKWKPEEGGSSWNPAITVRKIDPEEMEGAVLTNLKNVGKKFKMPHPEEDPEAIIETSEVSEIEFQVQNEYGNTSNSFKIEVDAEAANIIRKEFEGMPQEERLQMVYKLVDQQNDREV